MRHVAFIYSKPHENFNGLFVIMMCRYIINAHNNTIKYSILGHGMAWHGMGMIEHDSWLM